MLTERFLPILDALVLIALPRTAPGQETAEATPAEADACRPESLSPALDKYCRAMGEMELGEAAECRPESLSSLAVKYRRLAVKYRRAANVTRTSDKAAAGLSLDASMRYEAEVIPAVEADVAPWRPESPSSLLDKYWRATGEGAIVT